MPLATVLASHQDFAVRLFFMGDRAWCAESGYQRPVGVHDVEWMIRRFVAGGRKAGVCRTCMEAHGINENKLIEGTHRSTLDELSAEAWRVQAEKVIVF